MDNITNSNILLNVLNSRMPVTFYDFDVVTYIVYRSDSLKARQTRKYISKIFTNKNQSQYSFLLFYEIAIRLSFN